MLKLNKWLFVPLAVITALWLIGNVIVHHKNAKAKAMKYQTVETWDIPGGRGCSILIIPKLLNEKDMTTLGATLKSDQSSYTNAIVYVYTDINAAKLRSSVSEEKADAAAAKLHDTHYVGIFSKLDSKTHTFDVYFEGSRGNNNKKIRY